MDELDRKIKSKELYTIFDLLGKRKLEQVEGLILNGIKVTKKNGDTVLQGLFHSAHGIFFKLKKEFRKAWKAYEQAEKLIPDDPSLKIISAQLLLDYFSQYDIVIRKMNQVLRQVNVDFVYVHQANTLQGFAYLKKNRRQEAIDCLKRSVGKGFEGIQSAINIDLRLVEAFMKKKWEVELCRSFFEAARGIAHKTREAPLEKEFAKFLALFPAQ